jgi:hypothetical protein
MAGTGDHHVKENKISSERQGLHVFSHLWKIDANINLYKNTKMIIYTYIKTCW